MDYLKNYINNLSKENKILLAKYIERRSLQFSNNYIKRYSFLEYLHVYMDFKFRNCIIDNVLGIISVSCDNGFAIFIVLVNNRAEYNTVLQKVDKELFDIYINNASATARYYYNNLVKPSIIILKKEEPIIQYWIKFLSKFNKTGNNPFFIIDIVDENSTRKLVYQLNLANFCSVSTAGVFLTVNVANATDRNISVLTKG